MKNEKKMKKLSWKEILHFLKTYGFIFESNKIYGGLASIYDYGPIGNKLKWEIKKEWWKYFVEENILIHGFESSILTHPQTLKASGHIDKFIDHFFVCPQCKKKTKINLSEQTKNILACPECKNKLEKISYNLLFKTSQGSEEKKKKIVYLRPETAQGIFTNFKQITQTLKLELPFGIAQIGKSFRNELTTQYANFRSCEFEQMEIEFFFSDKKKRTVWFNYWQEKINVFLFEKLSLKKENIQTKTHKENEVPHYAQKTLDFEYNFPFGWREIWGLSDRGNFDMTQHQQHNQENLTILDAQQNKIIPYVIEPSAGVERLMLSIIIDNLSLRENKFTLKLPFQFCYYQIAILPLTEKLNTPAQKLIKMLEPRFSLRFDSKKSIGKRYLFHDAIGTFFCITFDFDSIQDQKVTVRFRDNKQQKRVLIENLTTYLQNEIRRQ